MAWEAVQTGHVRDSGMTARVDHKGTITLNKEATNDWSKYYSKAKIMIDREESLIGLIGNNEEGANIRGCSTHQSSLGSFGLYTSGLAKLPDKACYYRAYVADKMLIIDLKQPLTTQKETPKI